MAGKRKINLQELSNTFHADLKAVKDAHQLEEVRVEYLGRKDGQLTKILRSLKDMSVEERRKIGPAANALRKEIEGALEEKLKTLLATSYSLRTKIDVTMPGKKIPVGHLHPLTLMENQIREIFRGLNFSVVEGPEVETEHYNFDALNIPANHPARDMWDTFWLTRTNADYTQTNAEKGRRGSASSPRGSAMLLRTHTSPVQIRYMEQHRPPFQIIVPGRVFRYEATDASHEINFHQVEGLMVGSDVTLANFKYVIDTFFKQLFGPQVQTRFRPSYFPFVEPGLEVDILLDRSAEERGLYADLAENIPRKSASSQRKSAWLEVMGAGMVHPNVFRAVGYDPNKVQGFAFGLGLERLAMIKYKIPDIRLFYSGDLRFINQF